MTLTKRYRFSASHRLHSPLLTEEENRLKYGKCNNPFGHGHNYVLEVSIRGPVEARTGRVADPRSLDELVEREVIARFDHANLNSRRVGFGTLVPTTENLASEIRRRLLESWPEFFPGDAPVLEKIRLAETRRNIFET